jgi:hypothetical protein
MQEYTNLLKRYDEMRAETIVEARREAYERWKLARCRRGLPWWHMSETGHWVYEQYRWEEVRLRWLYRSVALWQNVPEGDW